MRDRVSLAAFFTAVCLFCMASPARLHARVAVQIGPAPVCPYGYYPDSPYDCAPYGYYGPEWFPNGVFIGAGPWFHGDRYWHGRVDNHFDRRYGYRGDYPRRGERDEWQRDHWRGHPHNDFRGNDMRDGHGHEYRGGEHGHDRGR